MLVVRPHTVFRHAWILVQPLKKIFSPSYSLRSRIAKCRDLWFFFFRITPLLPWVHSNESENFIPPLMLRTFELTINNTCFDWPFERRSQFQNEGMGTKWSSFQNYLRRYNNCKFEIIKLGQLQKMCLSRIGWWDGCRSLIHIYAFLQIWNTYMLNLNVHMPLLEAVKVLWPEDECFAHWTWMPSLEHVCFELLPKLLMF